jgi:hypothetical protein
MNVPVSSVKQWLGVAAIVGILIVAGQMVLESTTNISLVQTRASWVLQKYREAASSFSYSYISWFKSWH